MWASDPDQTPPSDGGAVSSWRDGSGNGRTFTDVGGSGARPTYRASASVLGNRPAIQFDGTEMLGTSSFTGVGHPYSFVMVGYNATPQVDYATILSAAGGGFSITNDELFYVFSYGSPSEIITSTDVEPGAWFMAGVLNGASSAARAGSAGSTTGTLGAVNASELMIGAFTSIVDYPWAGHAAFVGFYAGDVTAHGQYSALRSWANTYYGVTV